jgi:hypothetical protein
MLHLADLDRIVVESCGDGGDRDNNFMRQEYALANVIDHRIDGQIIDHQIDYQARRLRQLQERRRNVCRRRH